MPSAVRNSEESDMMRENGITVCSTTDTITVYWPTLKNSAADRIYTILLDGREVGTTQRTHYTLENLAPGARYQVTVLVDGLLMDRQEAVTAPRRCRLDVKQLGAAGDGRTKDTEILQTAINRCGPEQEVYLPAGIYLTGALRLHSGMALYLEEGAVLQGTNCPEDYLPRIHSRFEGTELDCYSSLLNMGELDHTAGPNCWDVLIYGRGTIASGGSALAMAVIEQEQQRLKEFLAENQALVDNCENERTIPGRVRPRLIHLSNCRNVRITGLTLKDGASWNIHMIYCDGIVTDHCTFISEGVWNGDGWDPDSSENCTLFASRFYTEDDSVAIKSGKNPEGNRIGRPSRHIRIFDCFSACGHGICIGSEVSGGIEDVRIWDCDLSRSLNGIEIKGTAKRSGYVRDIQAVDCVLPRLMVHDVAYNDDGLSAGRPPLFRSFRFERLKLTGYAMDHDDWFSVTPVELMGFSEPESYLRDVLFRDCLLFSGGQTIQLHRCENVSLENMRCESSQHS